MAVRQSDQFDTYPLRTSRLTTYDSRGGVTNIKNTPGFLHAITFAQVDAAPTAGTITVYDIASTSVYGAVANILFSHTQTTAVFMPQTVTLDIPFYTGLSVGVSTGMTDVGVTLSYK